MLYDLHLYLVIVSAISRLILLKDKNNMTAENNDLF
jgi:hypothetical protein